MSTTRHRPGSPGTGRTRPTAGRTWPPRWRGATRARWRRCTTARLSKAKDALLRLDEPVPDTPLVHDPGPRAHRSELAAEARSVAIQRSRAAKRAKAPHLSQELFLREHPSRLRGEL